MKRSKKLIDDIADLEEKKQMDKLSVTELIKKEAFVYVAIPHQDQDNESIIRWHFMIESDFVEKGLGVLKNWFHKESKEHIEKIYNLMMKHRMGWKGGIETYDWLNRDKFFRDKEERKIKKKEMDEVLKNIATHEDYKPFDYDLKVSKSIKRFQFIADNMKKHCENLINDLISIRNNL